MLLTGTGLTYLKLVNFKRFIHLTAPAGMFYALVNMTSFDPKFSAVGLGIKPGPVLTLRSSVPILTLV
jgi:hypothetical protein